MFLEMNSDAEGALAVRARPPRIRVLDRDLVAICRRSATTIVSRHDLISAHASHNTTVIHTRQGELRVHSPLSVVLLDLTSIGFVQIHRGTAVNVVAIRQLVGHGGHRVVVHLDDDRCLDVGRTFQRTVRDRLSARER